MRPYEPNWPHGYCTRDGKPVRVLCTDAIGRNGPIFGLVMLTEGLEVSCRWYSNGLVWSSGEKSDADLMCADQKPKEYWLCVGGGDITWHGSLDEARGLKAKFPGQNLSIYHAVEFLDDAAEKPS